MASICLKSLKVLEYNLDNLSEKVYIFSDRIGGMYGAKY